jgi:hypothetical protein
LLSSCWHCFFQWMMDFHISVLAPSHHHVSIDVPKSLVQLFQASMRFNKRTCSLHCGAFFLLDSIGIWGLYAAISLSSTQLVDCGLLANCTVILSLVRCCS